MRCQAPDVTTHDSEDSVLCVLVFTQLWPHSAGQGWSRRLTVHHDIALMCCHQCDDVPLTTDQGTLGGSGLESTDRLRQGDSGRAELRL